MTSEPIRPLVLIVEDDADTRDMYATYLEFSGIAVLSALNAHEAFELAVAHQPQMIVTDYRLGGSATGADLCRHLQEHERTRHIPTLLMTGSSRQQDTDAAIDAGCAQVRLKPYLPDALLNDVREALARV